MDPNPGRGMPLQLQRYWLLGKGAAKIRWDTPGDFLRCVRALRSKFPKNPEGLCNILHQKATGGPPGHGRGEHSAHTEEALTLLASQPVLGTNLWAGPMAPINKPTGEPSQVRMFVPGSIKHRDLPLPLRHRRVEGMGHQGAVTVGRILGLTTGPDEGGTDWVYAWGDWLDSEIIPEVTEARYLVDQGVAGASLDPGGRVRAMVDPETGAHHMMEYTMGGATLVAIPAFSATRLYNLIDGEWPDDDPDMDVSGDESDDCGCASVVAGAADTFTVNPNGWRGLPLAPRESVFDNDDAIKRISAWANVEAKGTDVGKLRKAFMWHDSTKPDADISTYRLPVGDIVNGRLTLIYHAIYAAAALISGAHGGLPDIPDEDKNQLRTVISEIYPEMAKAFNDQSIRAPWDRPANVAAREDAMSMQEEYAVADKEPYGDVTYADPGYQEDGKKRYPLDTEEHIRAAWTYINQSENAGAYSPAQLKTIKAKISKAMKKLGAQVEDSGDYSMAFGYPLEPPRAWFENPALTGKTPVTVDPNGHVYGHLAAWNECHRDVAQNSCVLAPKSRKEYAPFHLGHVFTAEGDRVDVGKIVMDTRHASVNLRYAAAAIHYDNTGDEVAVVRAGEDEFGIWVSGSMIPEASPEKAAKLRRSPLSGDWRSVDGNLELTAALAVNVPAFPVYAMDGDEQLALVAAGMVAAVDEEDPDEQEMRAWELRELLDEDERLEQRDRARRFSQLFAMDGEAAPEVPGEDPLYGAQGMTSRQLDALFSIIEEPGGGTEDGSEPEPVPADGRPVVPVGGTAPAGA